VEVVDEAATVERRARDWRRRRRRRQLALVSHPCCCCCASSKVLLLGFSSTMAGCADSGTAADCPLLCIYIVNNDVYSVGRSVA